MAVAERLGDLRSEHFAHHSWVMRRSFAATARRRSALPQALELAVALGDRAETSSEIQGVAMAAAGNGHCELALRLASAAAAEFGALAIEFSGIVFWMALLDRYLGVARAQLGPEAANAAWEEGRRLRFEDAVALALSVEA
jgi:hypothetical protein